MSLSKIVEELIKDPALRKRFAADPVEVMQEFRLTPRQRGILLSMDPTEVAKSVSKELADELAGFQIPGGEFRPESADFLAEAGGADPQYPSPKPGIFRYRVNPPFVYDTANSRRGVSASQLKSISQNLIELTVFGQSYHEAELKLQTKAAPVKSAVLQTNTFFKLGTFRNTILRAVFGPPGSANDPTKDWVVGDEFQVIVVNTGLKVATETKASTSLWVLA
jgi:hypothetical protein